MDCDYYLGNGDRHAANLYMANERDQIDFMKALWIALEEKPEWLTMEEIEEYEHKMIETT
jgi:hypothetical protein